MENGLSTRDSDSADDGEKAYKFPFAAEENWVASSINMAQSSFATTNELFRNIGQIMEANPELRGKSLIDLGCGEGRLCQRATESKLFSKVWGIELSKSLVQGCNDEALAMGHSREQLEYLCGDFSFPTFDLSSYSIILLYLYEPTVKLMAKKLGARLGQESSRCLIVSSLYPLPNQVPYQVDTIYRLYYYLSAVAPINGEPAT